MAIAKVIFHKCLSGYMNILPRMYICAGGQGRSPQSLTTATPGRCVPLKKTPEKFALYGNICNFDSIPNLNK